MIGGGEIAANYRNSETRELDARILQSIPAERLGRPVVFVGAAAGDAPGYFEAFRDYYTGLRAKLGLPEVEITFLTAGATTKKFREMILGAGLVYLGGGETKLLLEALDAWGAKEVFLKVLDSGGVLAGISAGAYALAAKSIHVDGEEIEVNDGLGLVPVICQAHATAETTARAEEYLATHPTDLPLVSLAEGEMHSASC